MDDKSQIYLRLFEPDGSWIARPDYMVLAALSVPDPKSIEHIYASMLKEDEVNPDADVESLTRFGKNIKKRNLERNVERRVSAGSVVLELCRLAHVLHKPPTVTAAQKLVAYHRHQDRINSTRAAAMREVKRYCAEFHRTLHLQAAAVYEPDLIEQLVGNEEATVRFLGLARGFENFIEANVVSNYFKWNPIGIPGQIPAVTQVEFTPLSDEDLKAAAVT